MLPNFYRFIAIFTFEDDGIHITFPDLPGCVSFAVTEETADKQAKDVLKLHLYGMEQDEEQIPQASNLKTLMQRENLEQNETFYMVEVYMPPFRDRQERRFVQKTLSLPYWLNLEAEHYGIDFSATLQNALKRELQLL